MTADWFEQYLAGGLGEPASPPACPDWCETEHVSDSVRAEFEELEGVREHWAKIFDGGTASVFVHQADDVVHRTRRGPAVYIEAEDDVSPAVALQLAAALMNAVDIVQGVAT